MNDILTDIDFDENDQPPGTYPQQPERWVRPIDELDEIERLRAENERLRADNDAMRELRGNLDTDDFENAFRVYILGHWKPEKTQAFALHLLGDEAQTQANQLERARAEFAAVYAKMPTFAKDWMEDLGRILGA